MNCVPTFNKLKGIQDQNHVCISDIRKGKIYNPVEFMDHI